MSELRALRELGELRELSGYSDSSGDICDSAMVVCGELSKAVEFVVVGLEDRGFVIDEVLLSLGDLVIVAEDGFTVGERSFLSIPIFVEYGGSYGTVSCEFAVINLAGVSEADLVKRVLYVLEVVDNEGFGIEVELVGIGGSFGYLFVDGIIEV